MTVAKDQILYTQGKDSSGSLIFAKDAEKGLEYFCPLCNTEFILRKSGNTGKGSKRPHFAHKNLTVNCTPETVLHFLFKTQAYELIKRHIEENKPLNFTWMCKHCEEKHSGNLLKKVKSVKLEYHMGNCIPDLALFDNDNRIFAVIEIVVTHKPDASALKFYKDNNIILIQFNLESELQLEQIEIKLSNPDIVDLCVIPKCEICDSYLISKEMLIIEGRCEKCKNQLKVAAIRFTSNRSNSIRDFYLKPKQFSYDEIEMAKSKGVNFLNKVNPFGGNDIVLNFCCKCNTPIVGSDKLLNKYIIPAVCKQLGVKRYFIDYHCSTCKKINTE